MCKYISIIKTMADVERNLFHIVFNNSDLRVEIFSDEVTYPEGTFYITMHDSTEEMRYAIIPTHLRDNND